MHLDASMPSASIAAWEAALADAALAQHLCVTRETTFYTLSRWLTATAPQGTLTQTHRPRARSRLQLACECSRRTAAVRHAAAAAARRDCRGSVACRSARAAVAATGGWRGGATNRRIRNGAAMLATRAELCAHARKLRS